MGGGGGGINSGGKKSQADNNGRYYLVLDGDRRFLAFPLGYSRLFDIRIHAVWL